MPQFSRWLGFKIFLQSFVILAVLLGSLLGWILWSETNQYRDEIIAQGNNTLNLEEGFFQTIIENNVTDVRFLKELTLNVLKRSHHTNAENWRALEQTFSLFSLTHPRYDQIRYINLKGDETIRVNNRHNVPSVVPPELLQNKKTRPYFYQTIQMPNDSFYVSPLEPNMEHGKIELPVIPVIRVSTPVIDQQKTNGIITLNYNARQFIASLKQSKSGSIGFPLLVNPAGEFIVGLSPGAEWSSVYLDRKDQNMSQVFPLAWKLLRNQKTNMVATANGGVILVRDLSKNVKGNIANIFRQNLSLLLMLYIPHANLSLQVGWYLFPSLILFVLVVGFSFLWMQYRLKKIAYDQKMKELATVDPLTKIANRNKLYEVIEQEITRSNRYKSPLSFVMLDIDFFKRINDEDGHDAGDQVLEALAKTCSNLLRATDTIGRFGGEEFVVVLPETDLKGAVELAEKLRVAAEKSEINYGEKHIPITISLGVATKHLDDSDFRPILRRVDGALYIAKNRGRNNVASEEEHQLSGV